jgi:hypothetical protein
MAPASRLVAFGFALASAVVALACFSAVTTPSHETEAKAASAAVGSGVGVLADANFGPILREPAEVLAVRRFPHDKRRPRPPRHRGERASSYTSDLELAASVIDSITHDDLHRPLLAAFVLASPLSGHPLELLRPPSVCA